MKYSLHDNNNNNNNNNTISKRLGNSYRVYRFPNYNPFNIPIISNIENCDFNDAHFYYLKLFLSYIDTSIIIIRIIKSEKLTRIILKSHFILLGDQFILIVRLIIRNEWKMAASDP